MSMDVVQTIRQLVDAGWHAAAAALERDCGIEVDDLYGSVVINTWQYFCHVLRRNA